MAATIWSSRNRIVDVSSAMRNLTDTKWAAGQEAIWALSVKMALITLLAILVPVAFYAGTRLRRRASAKKEVDRPFPFLKLPPELRNMVYSHLLSDPYYPPRPSPQPTQHPLSLQSLLQTLNPRRLISTSPPPTPHQNLTPRPRGPGFIFLASKQIYTEYTCLLTQTSTFHLTIHTTPTPAPLLPTFSLLPHIRRCTLRLHTSSADLQTPDPRAMAPRTWPIAHRLARELSGVREVRELEVCVREVSGSLWNPLWVWYHAMLGFWGMGEGEGRPEENLRDGMTKSDAVALANGPRVNRIIFTYTMDPAWPGQNHLARDELGVWKWCCKAGHVVAENPGSGGIGRKGRSGGEMTVREFCARLLAECRVCRPVDGEEGG